MMVIVGSKAGSDTNPDWVQDLRVNSSAILKSAQPNTMLWSPLYCRWMSGIKLDFRGWIWVCLSPPKSLCVFGGLRF